MFKLWSDYHVYVSTITKKYLLGKSVVIYRSFELLVCRDELLDGLVLHTWIRAALNYIQNKTKKVTMSLL